MLCGLTHMDAPGDHSYQEGNLSTLAMGDLSYVGETGNGCLIYRETSGRYVVSHREHPRGSTPAATLAGAYATCQALDMDLMQAQEPGGGS